MNILWPGSPFSSTILIPHSDPSFPFHPPSTVIPLVHLVHTLHLLYIVLCCTTFVCTLLHTLLHTVQYSTLESVPVHCMPLYIVLCPCSLYQTTYYFTLLHLNMLLPGHNTSLDYAMVCLLHLIVVFSSPSQYSTLHCIMPQ